MEKKLRELVAKARYECKKFALSDEAKDYDFHGDPALAGMCAIAACVIKDVLKYHKIPSTVYEGFFLDATRHCWVECGDYILDVTATQFSFSVHQTPPTKFPSIVVAKKETQMARKYLQGKPRHHVCRFNKWCDGQRPSREIVKKISGRILAS